MAELRLLWSDDEGPGRFQFHAYRLKKLGWQITWAASVDQATALLREQPFDAVLLDQMMPLEVGGSRSSVWAGCTILRWLKGHGVAAAAPPTVQQPAGAPRPENTRIPVAIASAYRHEDVESATREAMRVSENMPLLAKPLDFDAVLAAITRDVA